MAEHARTVAAGNNALTNKLYTELAKEKGNVFFSPISVHTILSLLHQGAEGETENALRSALAIPEKADSAEGFKQIMSSLNGISDVTLEMANKVYLKTGYNLKEIFSTVATKHFFAEAENINFAENVAAAKTINTWVEKKTKDKIKDLISSDALDALTRLVLVNAIYFKGNWADQFNPNHTTTEPFHLNSNETVDCQMMHKKRKYHYKEMPELGAKVLQIPYKNDNVSFVVVLPDDIDGITLLEEKMKNFDLSNLTEHMMYVEVEVSLPKFKVETTMDLNQPLKEIGFASMFGNSANLKGLLDSPEDLFVSKVIQKAFIEVNEEGAEAAAATGLMLACRMAMPFPQRYTFVADRPFFYYVFIRGTDYIQPMFTGKLQKPNK